MRKALPEFGSTSGWWMKTVQLDAEARGEVVRDERQAAALAQGQIA